MAKFDRYVLSQLMVLFGFFTLIIVAINWINQAVLVFDRLIADGQAAGTVLVFTFLSLPTVISAAMPLAGFAAAIYVTNRLNSESELVVVQATGFSPKRLALPFVVFGTIVALMVLVLMNFLVPISTKESARQSTELANNVTAQFLTPGEFLHPSKGITFYIGELSNEGVLKSVFLTDARREARTVTYIAREAFLVSRENGPALVMIDGVAQTLYNDDQRLSVTRFDDFAFDIGGLIKSARTKKPTPRELMTPVLLRADPAMVETLNQSVATFQWEGHRRFAQPMLSVVAALIGFSTLLLGAFSRFGVWRQIVLAVVLIMVVKMVDNFAQSIARTTDGAWALVYLPPIFGAFLVWAMLSYAGRNRRKRPTNSPAASLDSPQGGTA